MYSKRKNGDEISLWCDLDSAQEQSRKRKHDESISSTRQDKDAIDSVFTDLYEKHQDAYTKPQLRLWARMITCGIHESYNDPPDVSTITWKTPKQYKKESLSDAIAGAAVAIYSKCCNTYCFC